MSAPGRLLPLCRKTKMCRFFEKGECTRGAKCTFAHTVAELSPVPDLTKTKMCPVLLKKGRCTKPECNFAHAREELRDGPSSGGHPAATREQEPQRNLLLLNDLCVGNPQQQPPPEGGAPATDTFGRCAVQFDMGAFGGFGMAAFNRQTTPVDAPPAVCIGAPAGFSRQATPMDPSQQGPPMCLGAPAGFSRQATPMDPSQQGPPMCLGAATSFSRQATPMDPSQQGTPVCLGAATSFSRQATPMDPSQQGTFVCLGATTGGFSRQATPMDSSPQQGPPVCIGAATSFGRQATLMDPSQQRPPICLGALTTFSRQTTPMEVAPQQAPMCLGALTTFSRQTTPMEVAPQQAPMCLGTLTFSRQTTPMEGAQQQGPMCLGAVGADAFGRRAVPLDPSAFGSTRCTDDPGSTHPVHTDAMGNRAVPLDPSAFGSGTTPAVHTDAFGQRAVPLDPSAFGRQTTPGDILRENTPVCLGPGQPVAIPAVIAPTLQQMPNVAGESPGLIGPGQPLQLQCGAYTFICHPAAFAGQQTAPMGFEGLSQQQTPMDASYTKEGALEMSRQTTSCTEAAAAGAGEESGSSESPPPAPLSAAVSSPIPDESAFADSIGQLSASFSRQASPADSELSLGADVSTFSRQTSGADSTSSRRSRNRFHKTRMCSFHQMGRCRKSKHCNFAHGIEELNPTIDLSRTKMCPALINTGECNTEGCRFAHSREELRVLSANGQFGEGVEDEETKGASAAPFVEDAPFGEAGAEPLQAVNLAPRVEANGTSPIYSTEADASDSSDGNGQPWTSESSYLAGLPSESMSFEGLPQRLRVKNTFLCLDGGDSPGGDPMYKMNTAPAMQHRGTNLLSSFEERDEEFEKTPFFQEERASKDLSRRDASPEGLDSASVSAAGESEGTGSLGSLSGPVGEGLGSEMRIRVKNTFLDLEEGADDIPKVRRRRSAGDMTPSAKDCGYLDFSSACRPPTTPLQERAEAPSSPPGFEGPTAVDALESLSEARDAGSLSEAAEGGMRVGISEPGAQSPMHRPRSRQAPGIPSVCLSLPGLRI